MSLCFPTPFSVSFFLVLFLSGLYLSPGKQDTDDENTESRLQNLRKRVDFGQCFGSPTPPLYDLSRN